MSRARPRRFPFTLLPTVSCHRLLRHHHRDAGLPPSTLFLASWLGSLLCTWMSLVDDRASPETHPTQPLAGTRARGQASSRSPFRRGFLLVCLYLGREYFSVLHPEMTISLSQPSKLWSPVGPASLSVSCLICTDLQSPSTGSKFISISAHLHLSASVLNAAVAC